MICHLISTLLQPHYLFQVDPDACFIPALENPYEQHEQQQAAEQEISDKVRALSVVQKLNAHIESLPEGNNELNDVYDSFVGSLTHNECTEIEKLSKGQSDNSAWKALRLCRMTASEMRRIHTRTLSLISNPGIIEDLDFSVERTLFVGVNSKGKN